MTFDTLFLPNAGRKPVSSVLVESIAGIIRKAWKRRAQRNALKSLLQMPAHRLRDLGISPEDVLQAMNRAEASGAYLADRRASHALIGLCGKRHWQRG